MPIGPARPHANAIRIEPARKPAPALPRIEPARKPAPGVRLTRKGAKRAGRKTRKSRK